MKRTEEVAKLACPHCGGYFSKVSESDPSTDGLAIQRIRVCLACQGRYVTAERVTGSLVDLEHSSASRP